MLAIIPARGESKGLPGKNIKLLNGKPMIAYTIEVAKKSQFITRLVCSTDSSEIAEVAKKNGAEVPFMRSKELASDTALAIDNYIDAVPRYERFYNEKYESFIVLQPTSPLRTEQDIDKAIQLFNTTNADSVISFTESNHPPLWVKSIDSNLKISDYFINVKEVNRQELPKVYMPNGAIFVFKYSLLQEKRTYYSNKTYAYIIPRERSVDVDDILDFKFAEFLIRKRNARY